MDAGPQPSEIVLALREHELTLCSLYETFARLLPDMAPFWRRIAAEERAHEEVISVLSGKLASGALRVDRAKFTFAGIRSAISFIESRIARYSEEGVTRDAALATAIDVERGALEHEFFNLFEAKGPETLAEFDALAVHTNEHLRLLEEERNR